MRASLVFLAASASLVAAQTGYGRFSCSVASGTGFVADPSKCANSALKAPGQNLQDGGGVNQGDGPNPVDAQCVRQQTNGDDEIGYFCGIAGASCTSDANCDNGVCNLELSQCQGGLGQSCATQQNGVDVFDDKACSGFLYCEGPQFEPGSICGGLGAFCGDYTQGASTDLTDQENAALLSQFCQSGYCNFSGLMCDTRVGLDGDCTKDPQFACTDGLTCGEAGRCIRVAAGASQRARSRRAAKRSLCSAGFSACGVSGGRGWECVDTASNLEQCGACSDGGGVDCTALAGVDAVGCVNGQCEIWSCADEFAWDASSESCQPSTVVF